METKVYSKDDFNKFMDTLNIAKVFNDSMSFDNGVAYFKSSDRTMMIKLESECKMDVELNNMTGKIALLSAYIGDNVEIGKDDRNYIINNGSDIIKFPISPDPFKIKIEDYNDKFTKLVDTDNMLFSWDISEDKYNALIKYFEGFKTNEMVFDKDDSSPILKIRIGDESILGCAEIGSIDFSNMKDDLKALAIKTSCMFEFMPTIKKFNKFNLSTYYNSENEWIISICNIETDCCKIQTLRAKPQISSTYNR